VKEKRETFAKGLLENSSLSLDNALEVEKGRGFPKIIKLRKYTTIYSALYTDGEAVTVM